jgi:hypothetical protein
MILCYGKEKLKEAEAMYHQSMLAGKDGVGRAAGGGWCLMGLSKSNETVDGAVLDG